MKAQESDGAQGGPRVLIATAEAISRCAACRAYRRATLEGCNFLLYWCGRCESLLVITHLDRTGRPDSSATRRVTRHFRDEHLHLFESDDETLLIFLQTIAA